MEIFFGIVLIGIGVLSITKPQAMFAFRNLGRRWQFRDAEPTDGALIMVRISGVVEILVGFVLIFVGF